MPWEPGRGGGFTRAGVEPWLPMTDPAACNVADQRADPQSTLNLVRDLIALRRAEADLRTGAYEALPSPEGTWAWRRGDAFAVAANLGSEPAVVGGITGSVAVATSRARDGEAVGGELHLAPAEAAVVRTT
jgi:alpha-glucosidase